MTQQFTGQYLDPSRRPAWQSPYLLLSLCALFWAGNSVVGRALHESVPPVTLAFWRWSIALALLMPWVARPLWRQRGVIASNWKVMLLLSLLGVATYNTLNYTALQTTTATNSALINSVCVVLIIVVNFVLFRVHASASQWAGVVVSLAGTLVIVSRGDPAVLAWALDGRKVAISIMEIKQPDLDAVAHDPRPVPGTEAARATRGAHVIGQSTTSGAERWLPHSNDRRRPWSRLTPCQPTECRPTECRRC